jgi:hypothetical protein
LDHILIDEFIETKAASAHLQFAREKTMEDPKPTEGTETAAPAEVRHFSYEPVIFLLLLTLSPAFD